MFAFGHFALITNVASKLTGQFLANLGRGINGRKFKLSCTDSEFNRGLYIEKADQTKASVTNKLAGGMFAATFS